MPTSSTGAEIDEALALIEQNGGLGEFETDTTADIQRE
jgi:hypothetical protein